MKFGCMGGFSNPSQAYDNFTPFVQYRFSGGVPNRLEQTAVYGRDVYNVTNSDTVTAVNATYSPTSTTWLTPNTIATARYVRFNFQIDF